MQFVCFSAPISKCLISTRSYIIKKDIKMAADADLGLIFVGYAYTMSV